MSEDADWWPPEDAEVDPIWLPPFNGKTRFEYLSSTTPMVYKDAAHYLSDREFGKGDKYPDGRKYTANQMLHGIVYRFLFSEENVKGHVDPITSWQKLESHLKGSPRVAQLLGFNGDIPKNLDVPEGEEGETIARYKKRWRIETKYRMVKHEFTPKTRTQYHQVRNFFWNFSCVLYNAWVLLDVYLEADNPHIVHDDRHQFTANRFMKYFSEPEESD